MMLIRLLPLLFVVIAACSEKSTATYDIDNSDLPYFIKKAEAGDGYAQSRLVFYYRLRGDNDRADKWHDKCLALKIPKCLVEEASKYTFFPESEITSKFNAKERKEIALDLIDQAIEMAEEPEKSEWTELRERTLKLR